MTAKLSIVRQPSIAEGTFGSAYFSASPVSGFALRTVELPWKDNQEGFSCIPPGTYKATIYQSPHFNREVFLLHDVPNRKDIEIHPGNWAGDVVAGWKSEVHGCILPGFGVAAMAVDGIKQLGVTRSSAALNAMLDAMGDEEELIVEISGPVDASKADMT